MVRGPVDADELESTLQDDLQGAFIVLDQLLLVFVFALAARSFSFCAYSASDR
jgi:hypothetical protein